MRAVRSGMALLGGAVATLALAAATPAVMPGRELAFPRDYGSHDEFRTEWWYVTGWVETAAGETLGFQVTFFRARPGIAEANPSAFAARQFVIAHAAVSDPRRGRLWHEQRAARAVFGLAGAAAADTQVWLDDWRLERKDGTYVARLGGTDLGLELTLRPSRPPLLNGNGGYSQKGPDPASASYYYSVPQLLVSGSVRRGGRRDTVRGRAWLDHEWSDAYLDPEAAGWDWIGINLDDGGALMAFRIRDRAGRQRWAGATLARPDGSQQAFQPSAIAWAPGRTWRSPRTGITYPVTWTLRIGDAAYSLEPLLDDQESDSRATTGAIYWEGAVRARVDGRTVGKGYLELTGYGQPLVLP